MEKNPGGTPERTAENNSSETPGETLGARASGADLLIPDTYERNLTIFCVV